VPPVLKLILFVLPLGLDTFPQPHFAVGTGNETVGFAGFFVKAL
jgi:hypothetical protein